MRANHDISVVSGGANDSRDYNQYVTRQTHEKALLTIAHGSQTYPESVDLLVAYAELLIDSFTLGFGGSEEIALIADLICSV